MANIYRSWIEKRLALTGGESPVEITGQWIPAPDEVVVSATFRLTEPADLTDLRATVLLYENDVSQYVGPGSPEVWHHVTRAIRDTPIVLSEAGDEVRLSVTIPRGTYWKLENLHGVAYLQQTIEPKPIVQGTILEKRPDFEFDPPLVRSVPDGDGLAVFRSELVNRMDETDLLTLEPGGSFGNWSLDFLISGDETPHAEPVMLSLAPGEARTIQIRVQTDAIEEVRSGSFFVHSALSDRRQKSTLRLFNGSPSILLVDDDAGQTDELLFLQSLSGLGMLATHWDVLGSHNDLTPGIRQMNGYDVVIWETGWSSQDLISWNDQLALGEYLDQGGNLFFTSQEYLDWLWWTPNFFTTTYLAIETWEIDTGYERLLGAAGDPIGGGLDLRLSFPDPVYIDGDEVVASRSAEPCLLTEWGLPAAVRADLAPDAGRVVFLPCAFNAVDADAPDPHNARTLLSRILDWLLAGLPADVASEAVLLDRTRIESIWPNPVSPQTTIEFVLSNAAASDPVSLSVHDLQGRRVARLFETTLDPGRHRFGWDRVRVSGEPIEAGVYFVRLSTREGIQNAKIVLLPR